jgi:hypothetical protein
MNVRHVWSSILLLLGALVPASAMAVQTNVVIHRTPDAFGRGELDHIVVTEDGELSLSPAYGKVADLPDPIIWTTAADAQGNIYLATGNDGRVYRYKPGGKPEVVADFAELQVLALAVSPKGELFAATSPDGKIYRIPAGGPAEPFVDLEPKYLWDMVFDAGGDLLVATGAPGGVVRVTPGKEVKPVLKTEETHILTLAQDSAGHLYAGSAENGYVYKVTPGKPEQPFVMLDAPGDEVKRLVVAPDGAVIALTLGPAADGDKEDEELSGLLARATSGKDKNGPKRETRIYRMAPNRAPEELWRAPDLTAHSLGVFRGQILAGVGEEGKLISIGLDHRVSFVADCTGEQVTSLRPGPNNTLLVAVSNPAALFQMEDRPVDRGVFTSDVIDSGLFAHWGRIDLRQEQPGGGQVAIQTRSGNTDKPNTTWSDWSEMTDRIQSPPSRYIQYRLALKLRDRVAPRIREVDVFFLPVNSAPELADIVVMDPGIRLDRKEEFRSDPEPKGINRPKGPKNRPQTREREDAEIQSARWEANDIDQDDLSYTVQLREASSSAWRTLATEQKEEFVNFNATSLPDGWYQLKVIARDTPDNRPDDVRQDERISMPFPIDHTPPTLARTAVKVVGRQAQISFEAQDQTTFLDDGRYSIDGGPFTPLFPDDKVYDSMREKLSFTTPDLPPGDHMIVVTIEDGVGNVVTGKLPVTIK